MRPNALDEQIRAAFPHDHALLDQLVFRSDDVVRAARRGALAGELLVEVIEARLQRGDRLRLLLDRARQIGDLLRVGERGVARSPTTNP